MNVFRPIFLRLSDIDSSSIEREERIKAELSAIVIIEADSNAIKIVADEIS